MIRACEVSEVEKWEKFLNSVFEYTEGMSYREDFAPLFEPEALKYSSLYIDEAGEILSSATLYPKTVLVGAAEYKVGVVGAVGTREDSRGKGFSKKIFENVEAHARSLDLDALILWSDQLEYYEKIGFHPFGHQQIFSFANFDFTGAGLGSLKIIENWDENEDQIRKLYDKHQCRNVRESGYWDALSKVKSCTKWQIVGQNRGHSMVLATIAFNRGKDLHNIIHEWSCQRSKEGTSALMALVGVAISVNTELLWLTHPLVFDPIREELQKNDTPVMSSHLALVKELKATLQEQHEEMMWFWGLDSL